MSAIVKLLLKDENDETISMIRLELRIGLSDGERDGARTRDLRRDRPAL